MIKRIELVNFMSHERTVIEPSDGLTVLVGPNNCGKSAFVSALQILCHNVKSNYVMRHGEKNCEIIVETDDGHVIQWSRKKSGSPKYLIDGQEFDRLKGGVPDELHEILGLGKVTCEKDQFDIHFGEQKSPVFLLNDSGKASAQFFASSSDAIRLVEMQDRHKGKVRDSKRDQSRLNAEKNRFKNALECLSPVAEIDSRLSECEQQFADIQQAEYEIEEATINIRALEAVQLGLSRLEMSADCLKEISAPPHLADEQALAHLIAMIDRLETLTRSSSAAAKSLGKLEAPPMLSDSDEVQRLIDRLSRVEFTFYRLKELADAMSALEVPPELADELRLTEFVNAIASAKCNWQSQSKRARTLGMLTPVPPLADQTPLESILKQLATAEKSLDRVTNHLGQFDSQFEMLKSEMTNWLSQNPNCPTCGSETTVDQLISAGGHQHG